MSTTMTRATHRDTSRALPVSDPPATGATAYCPFPVSRDPRQFGLTTSAMRLAGGVVMVRHGRRTHSDTATILLHGAAGSWTTWTPLLAAASRDVAQADGTLTDLIIPDLPGFGESALPTDPQNRSVDALAAVVADIARALGYRRWNVIGHSMGGFIALQVAAAEPEATISVGLVSPTTFSVIESVQHPLIRCGRLPAYTALAAVMRILARLGRGGDALVRGAARLSLLRLLVSPLFSRPAAVDATVIAALATEVRPTGFTVASAAAGAYDAEARWALIRCPVRALNGDDDVFVARSDVDRLRGVIATFDAVSITDAGHFAHIEHPVTVLAILGVHRTKQRSLPPMVGTSLVTSVQKEQSE